MYGKQWQNCNRKKTSTGKEAPKKRKIERERERKGKMLHREQKGG